MTHPFELAQASNPFFEIVRQTPPAGAYLGLGVEHILLGIDHLLFVLGLMLLVPGTRRLVATVTAFTIAHSVTLALAVLGVVNVPSGPVEAIIALSIFFVAAEIVLLRHGKGAMTARVPWIVAGTFGLLHGFGFAGAIAEVGLPHGDVPLALLLFNLGVEAGQLAFIAVVLGVLSLARRLPTHTPRWAGFAVPYAMGSIALFWVLERCAAL